MLKSKPLDWTKRGPGTGEGFEVDFAQVLRHPRTGVQTAELATVAGVFLEKKTSSKPEVWDDITSQVSIGSETIVTGELANSAVTFVIAVDKDPLPAAGEDYQIVVEVTLDNGQGEAGFAAMNIWASAALV